MRKLATIRKIDSIVPIPDADAIECAVIGGWQVVVRKGEYKPGDIVIYCEIDSWLPTGLAPFLTKDGHFPKVFNGVEGERLRTIKLRGQVSQGLILPLDALWTRGVSWIEIDQDVTKQLGIQKWEAPIPAQLAGLCKGNFPGFIPKTDQERIQNLKRDLAKWVKKGLTFEITEKLDGSSMTVFVNDGIGGVCSRNLELKESETNTFWIVANKNKIIDKIRKMNGNFAIQFELVGPGIQGNRYQLSDHKCFMFDIFDIDNQRYLTPEQRHNLADSLDISHVPTLDYIHIDNLDLLDLIKMADGISQLNNKIIREGIVFKSVCGCHHFKSISNQFLLKGGT